MTDATVEYLDGEIEVTEQEPDRLPELTEMLGEKVIVEETVSNLRYRNKHPRVYRKASDELKSVLERPTKGETKLKDGTTRPIFVSHIEHCRAAYKVDKDKTTEVITKYALSEPLYVKGERAAGGGRISAGAQANANNFFAEGTEKVEAVAKAIEEEVPGYKVLRDSDGEVTPEALARGLMALGSYMKKQAEKKVLALVGSAT